MFRKKILMLFAAAVMFSVQAQDYQWKEAKSGGYTYKYVTNDPTQARFYTLKNGLTVILSQQKKTREFRLMWRRKRAARPILRRTPVWRTT